MTRHTLTDQEINAILFEEEENDIVSEEVLEEELMIGNDIVSDNEWSDDETAIVLPQRPVRAVRRGTRLVNSIDSSLNETNYNVWETPEQTQHY